MIVIVAEGDDAGGAYRIADEVKKKFEHFDTRVSVLGHMQRGEVQVARIECLQVAWVSLRWKH